MRRLYLKFWRVADDGTDWPIIEANLRFIAFNVAFCVIAEVVLIVVKLT